MMISKYIIGGAFDLSNFLMWLSTADEMSLVDYINLLNDTEDEIILRLLQERIEIIQSP